MEKLTLVDIKIKKNIFGDIVAVCKCLRCSKRFRIDIEASNFINAMCPKCNIMFDSTLKRAMARYRRNIDVGRNERLGFALGTISKTNNYMDNRREQVEKANNILLKEVKNRRMRTLIRKAVKKISRFLFSRP